MAKKFDFEAALTAYNKQINFQLLLAKHLAYSTLKPRKTTVPARL